MAEVLQEKTDQFVPRRGLRNGHAQTLAGNFMRRENLLPPGEARLFDVEKDVQILCDCHWQPERASRLTLLILHGLEGSIDSNYVIGTGSKAWALGWNVVRMNVRNCGGTEHLSATLYNSGLSSDVRSVMLTLTEQERLQRIALAGFSMGGNLVLKATGEWGDAPPGELLGVAAISPAVDLAASADLLHHPKNRIYEWKFLMGLRSRMKRKARLFPGRYDPLVRGAYRSIRDFDDKITAPHFGFAGAQDYYTRASAAQVADRIGVPALVIHSNDDPFIVMLQDTKTKFRSNPRVTFIETEHGGHCAFIAEANGYDGRWAERRAIEFLRTQNERGRFGR